MQIYINFRSISTRCLLYGIAKFSSPINLFQQHIDRALDSFHTAINFVAMHSIISNALGQNENLWSIVVDVSVFIRCVES